MTVANLRPTVEDFKKEALLKPEVKKEYERLKVEFDFTNAEQGKFYRPIEELEIALLLEEDVKIS